MGDIKKPTGLDWIQLDIDMGMLHPPESNFERIKRKCLNNPLVPIGASVTVGALSYGIFSMYRGSKETQQRMMRLRVAAQLFTVIVAVGGIFLSLPKDKRNFQDFIRSGEPESKMTK
ncbi:HIG1 domain family member 2A, mitochondrial [Copidosoma floridanum]|uniref:HIG1 domain family member 2A, mitochondrial n=1 Tax=Copidosoma floridanum TaxID=29053 RepID=UPI0006C9CC30|nr:HIG1 domain family member 2A, mitochondrial [Copidosoma floridanum]